jgi:hypothetical protein
MSAVMPSMTSTEGFMGGGSYFGVSLPIWV